MTADLDIYRTASVLIRDHGEDAALEAAQRADALLAKGATKGAATWRRVLRSVNEIERQEHHQNETSHRTALICYLGCLVQCSPDWQRICPKSPLM